MLEVERLSVSYGTLATDPPHTLQIVDTQGGETQKITSDSLQWIGNRGRMPCQQNHKPCSRNNDPRRSHSH